MAQRQCDRPRKLQWGHALSSVETIARAVEWMRGMRASMGPRSFKRGNEVPNLVVLAHLLCFNGATLFQAWKPHIARAQMITKSQLQWGHALSSVETVAQPEDALARTGRFNGATLFQAWKLRVIGDQIIVPQWGLQWGHALSSVETWMRSAIAARTSYSLQWGHALSSVETLMLAPSPLMILWLQWGHALSSVETRWRNRNVRQDYHRFNGATLFQAWKRHTPGVWSDAVGASMGPRSFKRGNVGGEPICVQMGAMLQWGHALSSVETCKKTVSPNILDLASMGPRSFKRGNFPSFFEELPGS